ncbi:aspartate beta-hydroxylase domain-containing protein 2-like [Haliotis cracherodii]|uniref:aspartate beta-hydroxylase domain-containing protein 2-like n=1 Tax=Haliotis rufescens TaxID=6454 RepID=UPI001EB0ABD3|nr:aspartate beta-hydroxylase domain-containing protein 2-like [Haliotis rufescens]XP_048237361.1 aspartate beta-hydroxylase domain-containing protein 2-like [Haliotis rufescens]
MLEWVYETVCENIWVLSITCVCFMLSKFYFKTRLIEIQDNLKGNSGTDDDGFEKCHSPSCVRCRTHKEILVRARTRLSYQAYTGKPKAEERDNNILKLCTDVENSLHKRFTQVEDEDQKPGVFKMSGLEAKPWWDEHEIEDFHGLQFSDKVLDDVKAEFFELMKKSNTEDTVQSLWKVNSTPDGMWSICHLMDQGRPTKAIEQCPKTWNAVHKLSHLLMKNNLFGNVAFSVIVPGTVITPHYGPTNIRLRCHIGIMVPPGCMLMVNGEERKYSEGDVVLFDDSFSHSVMHKGAREEGIRAVLMIDIWHPHIDDELKHVLSYIFSSDL